MRRADESKDEDMTEQEKMEAGYLYRLTDEMVEYVISNYVDIIKNL